MLPGWVGPPKFGGLPGLVAGRKGDAFCCAGLGTMPCAGFGTVPACPPKSISISFCWV